MDQNQPGMEPRRELLERSIVRKEDMLRRKAHERAPERFLEERLIWVIGGWGQWRLRLDLGLGGEMNQEELKPETELKALETSSWSLLLHEHSAKAKRSIQGINLRRISIS